MGKFHHQIKKGKGSQPPHKKPAPAAVSKGLKQLTKHKIKAANKQQRKELEMMMKKRMLKSKKEEEEEEEEVRERH